MTYQDDFIKKLASHPALDVARHAEVDVELLAHLAKEAMSAPTARTHLDRIRQSAMEIGLMALVCAHPEAERAVRPVKGVRRG